MFVITGLLWGLGVWQQSRDEASARRQKEDPPNLVNLGLDLQGGISVVLEPKAGQQADPAVLQQAANIITNRVDALGVAEPDVSVQGDNILIQLPGLRDQQRALKIIGTTAQLRFRPVLELLPPDYKAKRGERVPNCADQNTWPEDEAGKEIILCARDRDEAGRVPPPEQWLKLRLGPVALEGTDVSSASAELPPGQASWDVSLRLDGEGAKKFEQVTGRLACNPVGDPKRQFAIVLDRVVESHPQMNEDIDCNKGIAGGQAIITGNFRESEAKDLGLILRYGSLPIDLVRSTTTTISPTLGRESLDAGLLAGAIGLGIVFLYVLMFYRALGIIIWIGLLLHAAFTLAVVVLLGKTAGFALSLAGIAGLITSLGVATDSFIVYFERVKDEVHGGRTIRSSVDRAWQSAWRTILAADLVTALAAGVLYFLAVGSVRGFALMLGLATALDLFVSRWFMHPAVWLLAQTRRFNESRTLGVRSMAGMGSTPAPVAGGQR